MIIATAGHVDHGKTSLVNALTGVDTDRLAEEKQRGLTIDLGFAYTDAQTNHRLGFVDVPGHIRFINNMLAGVSGIDHALLIVAADDGVMPQTIEHLEILKLLGIASGTIAVTKIDRCDEDQITRTIAAVKSLVAGSFLEDADIYEVSSITGDGIETLKLALDIAADEIEANDAEGFFRLAIDRRFNVKGSGIVVTGSVFAGSCATGDELQLMPQGIKVRVRGLHVQNQVADAAIVGDRCAVNIASTQLELEDIHRGNWLTDNPAPASDRIDVRLTLLEKEEKPLRHWTPVHIHTAANHVNGRIALLEEGRLAPGESTLAQLVLDSPVNVCTGDRVIIRDQGAERTLGGGVVLDPFSPRRGRAKPERLSWLKAISPYDVNATINSLLSESHHGFGLESLANHFNVPTQLVLDLASTNDAIVLENNHAISQQFFDVAKGELTRKVESWHSDNPAKAGLPDNQVRRLVSDWPVSLANAVIEELIADGFLGRQGNQIHRPGFGIRLSDRESKIFEKALPFIEEDQTRPPVLHDLAEKLGTPPKELEKILLQVAKTGQLVRPVKNRFFTPAAMLVLKEALAQACDDQRQLTVKQYRDVTGIGRNLSIEILEYFDRQGVTRRIGDIRQITEQ